MPLFVQPVLRFLGYAQEQNGLIQTRNSTEYTQTKARETAETLPKTTPKGSIVLRGSVYTAGND